MANCRRSRQNGQPGTKPPQALGLRGEQFKIYCVKNYWQVRIVGNHEVHLCILRFETWLKTNLS